MAQLTVTNDVADARSLGGDWQRFINVTNTSGATQIKLSRKVVAVDIQGDTADLLIAVEGAAGVAMDSAAFKTGADTTRRVYPQHPAPTLTDRSFGSGSTFVQVGTNPTKVSLRAYSRLP